eukprot:TRINITY_DN35208_c0_g1_i1.p1 TRINITY_DN35208_c0_g1~~TRINITY_DN35208_c0_g1_i1.p1  ORF type:complete len:568 (+),score=231.73 TRINITY_DN35208_c0_g1_i1:75-1778(+)
MESDTNRIVAQAVRAAATDEAVVAELFGQGRPSNEAADTFSSDQVDEEWSDVSRQFHSDVLEDEYFDDEGVDELADAERDSKPPTGTGGRRQEKQLRMSRLIRNRRRLIEQRVNNDREDSSPKANGDDKDNEDQALIAQEQNRCKSVGTLPSADAGDDEATITVFTAARTGGTTGTIAEGTVNDSIMADNAKANADRRKRRRQLLLTASEARLVSKLTTILLVVIAVSTACALAVEIRVAVHKRHPPSTFIRTCLVETWFVAIAWAAQAALMVIRCYTVLAISSRTARALLALLATVATASVVMAPISTYGDDCKIPLVESLVFFLTMFAVLTFSLFRFRIVLDLVRSLTVKLVALCCMCTVTMMTCIMLGPVMGIQDNTPFVLSDNAITFAISSFLLWRIYRRRAHRRRVHPARSPHNSSTRTRKRRTKESKASSGTVRLRLTEDGIAVDRTKRNAGHGRGRGRGLAAAPRSKRFGSSAAARNGGRPNRRSLRVRPFHTLPRAFQHHAAAPAVSPANRSGTRTDSAVSTPAVVARTAAGAAIVPSGPTTTTQTGSALSLDATPPNH